MRMGIVQLKIEEDFNKNIEKVNKLTAGYKDTIFLLPELFTTGFDFKKIESEVDEKHFELLNGLNKENTYMGSIARKKGGKFYNSFFIKCRDVVFFVYDKVHLFPLMDEDKYFAQGDGYYTFEISGATAGAAICFDLRFCEQFFKLRQNGAKIMFLPAEWPKKRVSHFKTLSIARAIENQCYFICCNAVGEFNGEIFGGNSMIVDPWGEVVCDAEDKEDIVLVGEVDLSKVEDVRRTIPMR